MLNVVKVVIAKGNQKYHKILISMFQKMLKMLTLKKALSPKKNRKLVDVVEDVVEDGAEELLLLLELPKPKQGRSHLHLLQEHPRDHLLKLAKRTSMKIM